MSSSITVDKPQPNHRARGSIYRFIRPSRSLREELLSERSRNIILNDDHGNISRTPEDCPGKEHNHFWQKATSLRQSLRRSSSGSKSKNSDPKTSRLVRSVSQHHVENKDVEERQGEYGSQRHLNLSYNRKQHFESKPCLNQDSERSTLLSKQTQSLNDNDSHQNTAVPNQISFLEETNQLNLNSSVTSLATQHLLFISTELKHRTPHQRSLRKLTKDSGYETSAQGESEYINFDYLSEDGEKNSWTSSLTSVHGYSESQRNQWTHAVSSGRPGGRSNRESKEQPESRLSTNCFPTNTKGLRSLRPSQSYSEDSSSGRRRKTNLEQHLLRSTKTTNLRQSETIHQRHNKHELDEKNGCPRLESLHCTQSNQKKLQQPQISSKPVPRGHCKGFDFIPSLTTTFSKHKVNEDTNVATRKVKKGSVYETLTSKSGSDFAPVIQRRPSSERKENTRSCSTLTTSSKYLPLSGRLKNTTIGAEGRESPLLSTDSKQYFSHENLCDHTFESRKQNLAISEEMTKSLPFSLDTSLDKGRTFNNFCSKRSPPPPPPVRKSSMAYQRSGLYPSWPVSWTGLESSSLITTMATCRSHSLSDQTDYPKVRSLYSRPKKSYKISTYQLIPVQEKGTESRNPKGSEKCEPEIQIPLSSRTLDREKCEPGIQIPLSSRTLDREPAIDLTDSSLKQALSGSCTLKNIEVGLQDRQSYIQKYYTSCLPERDVSNNQEQSNATTYDVETFWSKYDDFMKHYSEASCLSSSAHESNIPSNKSSLRQENSKRTEPFESKTSLLDRFSSESQSLSAIWPSSHSGDLLETTREVENFVERTNNCTGIKNEILKCQQGSCTDPSSSVQTSNRSSLFDSGISTNPESRCLSPQSSCEEILSPTILNPIYHNVPKYNLRQENIARSAKVQVPMKRGSESVYYYIPSASKSRSSKEANIDMHELSENCVCQRVERQLAEEPKFNIPLGFSSSFPGCSKTQSLVEQRNNLHNYIINETPYSSNKTNAYNTSKLTVSPENGARFSSFIELEPHSKDNRMLEQLATVPQKEEESSSVSSDLGVRYSTAEADDSGQRVLFLDPEKKHRVSDPELKAIQKKAVLSFYQRQKGISESQPTGQEFSCSTSVAVPVYNPNDSPNQSTLSLQLDQKLSFSSSAISSAVIPKDPVYQCAKRYVGKTSVSSRPTDQDTDSQRNKSIEKLGRIPEGPMLLSNNAEQSKNAEVFQNANSRKTPKVNSEFIKYQSLSVPNLSGVISRADESSNSRRSVCNQRSHEPLKPSPSSLSTNTNKIEDFDHPSKCTTMSLNSITKAIQGARASKETEIVDEGPSSVYSKNSHRSEQKLGRQRFDDNYWTSSLTSGSHDLISTTSQDDQSPDSWEKLHNIKKQGTTLIFHSNSMRGRMWPEVVLGASNMELQLPTSQASQLDINVCDQPVTSGLASLMPFISEQISQVKKPSHKPESHKENVLSLRPLEKEGTQEDDSDVSRSDVSLLDPSECELLQTKLVANQVTQEKLTNKCSAAVNGQHNEGLSVMDNFEDDAPTTREGFPVNKTISDQHCLQQTICVASSDSPKESTVNRISCTTQTSDTPIIGQKHKTKEELDCERLSENFLNHCDDAVLRNLLVPTPNHKTMSDYMEGLFNLELERDGQLVRKQSSLRDDAVKLVNNYTMFVNSETRKGAELPSTSAYYATSESRAKFLTRYSQDVYQQNSASGTDLSSKKEELIASINKKLDLLRLEQTIVREEMVQNEELGKEVTSRVEQLAKPNELEKYRLHVQELEKIISLLLSLSGRLARAQNALVCLGPDIEEEEKKALEAKCDKLSEQHEEARWLKESIDKRSHQVSTFLRHYLSTEEYADYDHFIKMKSKLLVNIREIQEKIKLGEEQLAALRNNVNF
ncbi:uncharacterized protein LOC143247684 isoform X2 [Tachypleus tridentatus]|uniref:uncharacterized protein LOC143247684 isoform X2 n=1 Tax=Tachypleus tridentatus TaxID=6853 RepID=UPI003FD672DD